MAGIEDLRASVAREVVAPEDTAYEDARKVWNGMIDRVPERSFAARTSTTSRPQSGATWSDSD